MQKLFWGCRTILDVNPVTDTFCLRQLDKNGRMTKWLRRDWINDRRFDLLNFRLAETIVSYTRGLCFKNQYMMVCSLLTIKPLQTVGLRVRQDDVCSQWISMSKSDTAQYHRQNLNYILDLHKSKLRFRNQNLIFAVFTSHYENWLM